MKREKEGKLLWLKGVNYMKKMLEHCCVSVAT